MLIMFAGMAVLGIIGVLLAMIHPALAVLVMVLIYPFQLYIMVKVSMALPISVVEGLGAIECVKQSFQMTRKHFWPLLLCFFVTYVAVGVASTPLFLLFILAMFLPPVPAVLLWYVMGLGCMLLMLFIYVLAYHVYTALRGTGDSREELPPVQ
jgi:membrane-anchored glycerophosphoryl diester phosphodiesterase (GDPDase)